ncbi:MAG: hypothetical protein QXS38_02285 [Candidatus Pacearchaeota archaeon]
MFFNKKDRGIKCENCKSKISNKFNFCPFCGQSTIDEQKELREFGLLGRNDFARPKEKKRDIFSGFGITDNVINSIMNSVLKSFDKQFKELSEAELEADADIEQSPNGIKIKIGLPASSHNPKQNKATKIFKNQPTEEQINKMKNLPRTEAKTTVRRLSDKVIYELITPGLESPDNVFISKLETGYEIKAIAKKKVYVNNLPISLPIKNYSLSENKLLIEFKLQK